MKRSKCLAAACLLVLAVLFAVHIRPLAVQTLRVGICPDAPPYQFQDDNGRLTGMHIDFLNYIGYLKGYTMDYVSFQRASDAVTALEKGEVDIEGRIDSVTYSEITDFQKAGATLLGRLFK